MAKAPVRVAVTGAAGQIGYSLLFRIASGQMLGPDQPVVLQLLEIPDEKAQKALKGVMMELDDCAFPLLAGMSAHADPNTAFKDAGIALLVGARPRGPGMERKDLLSANAQIFTAQGKALDAVASRDVKVLVVGNPANTNAHIAMKSAPGLPRTSFTAMLRLDHNRAISQLAAKAGKPVSAVEKMIVWGNHSPTMYPDYRFATIDGQPAPRVVPDQGWYRDTFIPTVGKRGAAIIEARGLSSAASAANAAIDHVRERRPIPCDEIRATGADPREGNGQRLDDLKEAIAGVRHDQREVVVLRQVFGLSPGEIARRLGKSEGAVHGLHHRGRRAVQDGLKERGATPVTRWNGHAGAIRESVSQEA